VDAIDTQKRERWKIHVHVNCKMKEIVGRINRLGIFRMANESLSVTLSHQRKKKKSEISFQIR